MPTHTLIATLVGGIALAFIFGMLANRLRISPLVGYLLAGIAVGPFTPGFVADIGLAQQLAEIGIILLMFSVGLHFSLEDLMSVKNISLPGAVVQIAAATAMGVGMSQWMGWPLGSGMVFGLCLSVASTVVLLRALEERGMLDSRRGRIAVGWLIVEDLAMVLALVVLPAIAGMIGGTEQQAVFSTSELWMTLGLTIGKVTLFIAIMLVVGRRFIPRMLERVALTGSRELFTLSILTLALGIAFIAYELFGASFALGAFFAGMVLCGSELSHDAVEQSLPLRDTFSVLFFVSVGMLFDPHILISQPLPVLSAVLIIVVGKSLAAFLIVLLFRYSLSTALTVAVSLAQVGEFSFILAGLGVELKLLSADGYALVLAGSIISILLNPILFGLLNRFEPMLEMRAHPESVDHLPALTKITLTNHVILVGYGRVGRKAAQRLQEEGMAFVVLERELNRMEDIRQQGMQALLGNADRAETLAAANIEQARTILVAIPNGYEAGHIVVLARQMNPRIEVIARAHFDAEVQHLREQGAQTVLMAEHELAERMVGIVGARA